VIIAITTTKLAGDLGYQRAAGRSGQRTEELAGLVLIGG
jgi:hypothetical protein